MNFPIKWWEEIGIRFIQMVAITVVKADLNYRRTGLFISSNDENIKILSAKVKNSFDPKSILNPGKIYAGI